jgi:hypothetical protein
VRSIPRAHLHAGSRQHLANGAGKLTALHGIDSALSTPGVVSVFMDSSPGKHVAQPPADFTSAVLASVVAAAGSREDLETILRDAEGKLKEVLE